MSDWSLSSAAQPAVGKSNPTALSVRRKLVIAPVLRVIFLISPVPPKGTLTALSVDIVAMKLTGCYPVLAVDPRQTALSARPANLKADNELSATQVAAMSLATTMSLRGAGPMAWVGKQVMRVSSPSWVARKTDRSFDSTTLLPVTT